MPSWLVWVIVAVGLGIGEILTPGLFFLGPLALAAGAAAIVAAAGAGWFLSLLVFALGSIASLAVLRPIARSHLRQPAMMRTGTAKLIGASAIVVERVDSAGGRVKLAGEVWSARSLDEQQVIEPGTRVEVAQIDGATAVVYE